MIDELVESVDGLTKAGARALRMENQQLKQQQAQTMAVIGMRGQQTLGQFLEGLQALIAGARQGDVQSRENLKLLADAFDEMRLIKLIKVPGQQ